jgi:exodeoxyribonuclease V beta subunit
MIKEFDILTHPLNFGTQSLIEASAGTGKTTALENLVLRLLIDGAVQADGSLRQLELSEILLVTFTEAATAELIQRVRENISHALELLKSDELSDDITSNILQNSRKSREEITLALRMALLNFDENAISTIHGFCKKMLSNFTFESNSRFNLELISDDRPFLEEVVNDYWRMKFYNINDELEEKIIKAYKWKPGVLHSLFRNIQSAPLTEVIAPVAQNSLHDSYADFEEYCLSSNLLYLLNDCAGNFGSAFRKKILNALNCFISFQNVLELVKFLKAEVLEKNLLKKTNWDGFKDSTPLEGRIPKDFDKILELAEQVERSIEDYLVGLKFDFIDYVRKSGILKQKKLDEGVLSFDDLLMDMYEAVYKSEEFCKLICKDFPVVMLDEFQDTDVLQFQIFNKIFRNDEALMLMVGDPKQSIYQFRGADIFSYLQVSENLTMKEKSTLTKNYRSDEALLKTFNTIFDIENPFIEKSINYFPASAGRKQRKLIIEDDSDNNRKLKIIKSDKISKDAARKIFNKAISSKIVSILSLARQTNENGQALARFEDEDGSTEPVRARDIAVLVARNEDAQAVYEQLANVGVHATLQQSGNIFESNEATELLLLFNAIIRPGDASKIKSVLATSLFRLNASALEKLGNDCGTPEMELWQEIFFTLLQKWQEKGFIQMFFQLLRSPKSNVKANLLTLPQGERRLTNLLHLMELLHQRVVLKQLSPTALIYWLHQQITNSEDKDEHELRLESDDSAVKIMTVHKSKGLQFPIVFCANLWQKEFVSKNNEKDFFYHDRDLNGEYKQHFEMKSSGGEFEKSRLLYRKEGLGELIRLAYVALTRAKNYCCFTWGEINQTGASALGYLSECPTEEELNILLQTGSNAGMQRGWQAWQQDDNIEIIDVSNINLGEGLSLTGNIEAPEWKTLPEIKAVPRDWGIMSFSAITDGSHQEDELRPGDDDESNENDNIPTENLDLFSGSLTLGDFPRGPVAGNCIHSIFEKINFADVKSANWRQSKAIEQMIKDQLFMSGMLDGGKGSVQFIQSEVQRYTQVCDMLENVLTCALPGQDGAMRLCDLKTENYRPEMQFFFPADKVLDSEKINELLEHLSGRKSTLPAVPLRGFVNGFIDLVFESNGRYYIIDWKSNDLGGSLNDYDRSGMAQSMHESYYYLQSAIYLFSLHKYLKKRIPDYDFKQHIGGAFYMYVRGIKNDFADTGIYSIKPEIKTLELLETIFEAAE